ncbi:MAG: murein biosynthesis integral membrane protein MurJ [Sphaerochaetaceae bacterium]
MNKPNRKRNTFIVALFTLISRLLGIIRVRVISSIFGAGAVADVINFTFSIPNNFRKLFSEGALHVAIIPEFSKLKEDERETQVLHFQLLTIQFLISIIVIVISFLFGKPIVNFLSSFTDQTQLDLAYKLLPLFSIFLVFILFSSYFSAILQSRNAFLIQAISPLFYSLSVIVVIFFFTKNLGPTSIGIGAIIGGGLQFFINYLRLVKEHFKFRLLFKLSGEHFFNIMRKWLPAILTALIGIISQQIAFYFASSLGEGSVSAFSNSIIFWQTPYGIFFTAVATVSFPLLSVHTGDKLNKTFSDGLNQLVTFLLPSSIFLFFFRKEAISLILMTGKFTRENTIITSKVLAWYLIGLLIIAWYNFIQKLCYSKTSEKIAFKVSVLVMILDVISTFLFIRNGFGIISLPIANLISHLIGMSVLLNLVIKKELTNFDLKPLISGFMKRILACLPLLIFCFFYQNLSSNLWELGSSLKLLYSFSLYLFISGGITVLMYKIMKINIF